MEKKRVIDAGGTPGTLSHILTVKTLKVIIKYLLGVFQARVKPIHEFYEEK